MKFSFSVAENEEIQKIAKEKKVSSVELTIRYCDIVQQNFWQDLEDAADAVWEDENEVK